MSFLVANIPPIKCAKLDNVERVSRKILAKGHGGVG